MLKMHSHLSDNWAVLSYQIFLVKEHKSCRLPSICR